MFIDLSATGKCYLAIIEVKLGLRERVFGGAHGSNLNNTWRTVCKVYFYFIEYCCDFVIAAWRFNKISSN